MSQKLRPLKKTNKPIQLQRTKVPVRPSERNIFIHEVRFVERKNGKMHNVEIFTLEEFVAKFASLQEEVMQKPWYAKLRKNYVRDASYEVRHKFKSWFFDRLLRNLNK